MTVTSDLTILFALSAEAHLSPKTIGALLTRFEEPQAIWDADLDEIAQAAQLREDDMERVVRARGLTDALTEELELIIAGGTIPVSMVDPCYPRRLLRLPDPPTILYVRGTLPDEANTAVAVVGTHQADADGIANGVAWGKGLAQRDAVVVSGLARGIDGAAHVGALAASGTTLAVLGGGFDNIYPPEHATLAAEIAKTGALLSEYPPRAPLTKPRLVARNRIIVGLSDAVVVVRLHADARGSMEAIRKAADLAIPVFLVATDAGPKAQEAVADGAVPIGPAPDFDLVLNYL